MEKEARQKLAVEYNQCSNCCQSVLLACRDLTGMDEKAAISIGSCFAGGMFNGEVCGAVTGGLMVLGACLPGKEARAEKPRAAAMAPSCKRDSVRSTGRRCAGRFCAATESGSVMNVLPAVQALSMRS